jgi:hypothetical protein
VLCIVLGPGVTSGVRNQGTVVEPTGTVTDVTVVDEGDWKVSLVIELPNVTAIGVKACLSSTIDPAVLC